jgi:hypothetical protein
MFSQKGILLNDLADLDKQKAETQKNKITFAMIKLFFFTTVFLLRLMIYFLIDMTSNNRTIS